MSLSEAISRLKELDLSKYPVEKIQAGFKDFGNAGYIGVTLHPTKKILRARMNENNERFLRKEEMSYKPQKYNKTYQRGSTPGATRFYGSLIPEILEEGELDNERFVATFEVSKWFRNDKTCGQRKITYSRWNVVQDLKLIAIANRTEFYNASSYIRSLVTSFEKDLKQHPELTEKSLQISDFLASEFSKIEHEPDYHYLISALFTDLVIRHGFDGILYPSVRAHGGFNIAITPNAADNKLKFIGAGECLIYKHFSRRVIDNITINSPLSNDGNIEYVPINDPRYHAGEQKVLAEMGLNSIDDLCKK